MTGEVVRNASRPESHPRIGRGATPNVELVIEPSTSIRKRAYDYLRDEILGGRIPPGARLVEGHLARQIKVSRTPIREALHLLEREGLLDSSPRVGYRVKPMEREEVEEICAIRAVNEALAAQWAIDRIRPEELVALERNLIEAEAEIRGGAPRAFVERDAEFHEILVRASGSQRLLELCQTLRRHMLRYRIESLYVAENGLRAIHGHRRILDRIRDRDRVGVATAVHDHLDQSKRDVWRYAFEMPEKR
jgi:GntR family transcriptional regulator, rspAB operon transcriptional repressor